MTNSECRLIRILILVPLIFVKMSVANVSARSHDSTYCQAWRLFEKKHYNNSQVFLDKYLEESKEDDFLVEDVNYYNALSSMKLGRVYGEYQLLDFAKEYPDTKKSMMAHYVLGNTCLQNQEFNKAIDYYTKVDIAILDSKAANSLNYNLAYSYLSIKDFKNSLPLFSKLADCDNMYKVDASYYAGFIEFRNDNYENSIRFLTKISEEKKYKPIVPYLIAQNLYRQKKFDDLIFYIGELKEKKLEIKNKNDLELLLAEAFFFKKDYIQAIQAYESYFINATEIIDSAVLYRLAYSFYMTNNMEKAERYFTKLTFESSPLGQLACYYMGAIFIDKKEFDKALATFEVASKLDFDKNISEQSALNYAKINFSIKNYDAAIQAFLDFKNQYPKSNSINEVDQLLSLAYMSTNNYDLAIAHIEGLEKPSPNILKVYQKITFLRAVQSFNIGDYDAAMSMTDKSLKYKNDDKIVQHAKLLQGDIFAMQSKYDRAMKQYEQVLQSKQYDSFVMQMAIYGLGYAYFNMQDYKNAYEYFLKLENANAIPNMYKLDAKLRLADSCYAIKSYHKALTLYQSCESYNNAHCIYYEGMIYNILGLTEKAHDCFGQILSRYTDSIYYENALFENASTFLKENKYDKTVDSFSFFIEKRPKSILVPKALLYRAISWHNMKKYDQAIGDYVSVLDRYIDSPCAENALLGIQQSLIAQGRSEDFAKYLDEYKINSQDSESIEKAIFVGCRAVFYEQQYDAAVIQLTSFIAKYPKSSLLSEAHYLLGESFYILGKYQDSIKYYEYVLSDEQSPCFTKVLFRLASVHQTLKEFDSALLFFEKLKNYAKTDKEKSVALEGAVKAAFALKKYNEAKENASLYMNQPSLPIKSSNEVNLILAKVAIEQAELHEAKRLLVIIAKSTISVQAAEAQYLLAWVLYQEKNYKASLNILFELNKIFSQYKEWKDKSYLLISDNYIAIDEKFQAKATLQSIVEKCSDKILVVEAELRLKKINALLVEESAKNSKKAKPVEEFKVI